MRIRQLVRQEEWNDQRGVEQLEELGYLEGANESVTDELLGIEHLDLNNLVKHFLRTLLEVEVHHLVGGGRGGRGGGRGEEREEGEGGGGGGSGGRGEEGGRGGGEGASCDHRASAYCN